MSVLPELDHVWSVRVLAMTDGQARAYARSQAFSVNAQASLRESDPHPSAVEYLLGALGCDLACGFRTEAAARSITLRGLELSLAGRLDNVLAHLGVLGEQGHPGLRSIAGTVYVSADGDRSALETAWHAALARSPLFNTLMRCAEVVLALRIVP